MPNDPQTEDSGTEPIEPQKKLDRNQKLAAAGLGVFAFLVVILWFVQLKSNIYAPFNSGTAALTESAQIDSQTAGDLALKNKDTDADGLSDYDELNIYKTSPYLDDSDSDGLKDGAEVKGGSDPNCPQGRTCASSGSLNTGAGASASPAPASGTDALNNILNQYSAVNSATPPVSPADGTSAPAGTGGLSSDQVNILKNIDAAGLRKMLLGAGMDQATLDQVSDEELMASYRETLNGQGQ